MEKNGTKKRKNGLKRSVSLLLCSLLAMCGCGPSNKDNSGSFVKVTKEKELYLNHCANCHGGNREGSFGPPLKGINKKYSPEQVLKIIQQGKGNMPAQDYISKNEQQELAKWLSKK